MMLHQDGSHHEWISGQIWDLIVTMDDATGEHYHMQFVEEEGTRSSFQGVEAVIRQHGIFSAIYTDRGSHYWFTPEVGGKVDRERPTQFGRAMQQLGIEMIAAYSPQARGRSERAFRTHQDRLVRELAAVGVTDMPQANRYLTPWASFTGLDAWRATAQPANSSRLQNLCVAPRPPSPPRLWGPFGLRPTRPQRRRCPSGQVMCY